MQAVRSLRESSSLVVVVAFCNCLSQWETGMYSSWVSRRGTRISGACLSLLVIEKCQRIYS